MAYEVEAAADVNGDFCVFFRPGLGGAIAITGTIINNSIGHLYRSTLSTPGPPTNGTWPLNGVSTIQFDANKNAFFPVAASGGGFDSFPEAAAVRDSTIDYRVMSAGLMVGYDGAPLDASGRFVAANVPGYNPYPLPQPSVADGMNPIGDVTLWNYDDVRKIPGAISSHALDGASCIWMPDGPGAYAFRPTRFVPSYAQGLAGTMSLGVTNLPVCDSDPDAWFSRAAALTSLANLQNLYNDGTGAPQTAASQDILSKTQLFQLTLTTTGDSPGLIVIGKGLVASAVLRIQFAQVLGAVADS
jgi:hypothetical protein